VVALLAGGHINGKRHQFIPGASDDPGAGTLAVERAALIEEARELIPIEEAVLSFFDFYRRNADGIGVRDGCAQATDFGLAEPDADLFVRWLTASAEEKILWARARRFLERHAKDGADKCRLT
jgi:hypothetical protein